MGTRSPVPVSQPNEPKPPIYRGGLCNQGYCRMATSLRLRLKFERRLDHCRSVLGLYAG